MGAELYKNIAGKRVPSVTTIISGNLGWNKGILMNWQLKMFREGKDPEKIRNEAADTGTLVHNYVEAHIYGTTVSDEDKKNATLEQLVIAERGLEQYKLIEKERQLDWKEVELKLISEKYQYGGKLDGLCTRDGNGVICLTDTKTSNYLYAEFLIQLAAYRGLLVECTEYNPEEFFFIHISKDLTKETEEIVKIVDVPDSSVLDTAFDTFLMLRDLHEKNKQFKKILKGMGA